MLIIGPGQAYGGLGRFVNDFCSFGEPFDVALHNIARPLRTAMKAYRVNGYGIIVSSGVGRLFNSALLSFRNIARFPRRLSQVAPDIVYCASGGYVAFWDACPYLAMTSFGKAKVVLHWLGPFQPFYEGSGKLTRGIIRAFMSRVSAFVVLTSTDAISLRVLFPSKPVALVPSYTDIQVGTYAGSTDLVPDADRHVDLLFMAGVDPYRKGLPLLLACLPSTLRNAGDSIRLVVTGGDACRSLIESAPEEVRDHVLFLGWIPEYQKRALYEACDVAVLPSYREGMPYTLVEAMACGLPVVASRVGGIPDLIEDGRNGYLIPPGDAHVLSDRLTRLALEPESRRRMSQANTRKAREEHSASVAFRRIEALCSSLL